MLYTVANTFRAGRRVLRFIDGAGTEYARGTLEADTDTGRMITQTFGPDSNIPLHDTQSGELILEQLWVPLPLRVVFDPYPRPEADA